MKSSYCGVKFINGNRSCGHVNVHLCECIKCLKKYLKVNDNERKKLKGFRPIGIEKARLRLKELEYKKSFGALISEGN